MVLLPKRLEVELVPPFPSFWVALYYSSSVSVILLFVDVATCHKFIVLHVSMYKSGFNRLFLGQEIRGKHVSCKESDSDGKVSKVELEFSVLIPTDVHPHFQHCAVTFPSKWIICSPPFLLTWWATGFWRFMTPLWMFHYLSAITVDIQYTPFSTQYPKLSSAPTAMSHVLHRQTPPGKLKIWCQTQGNQRPRPLLLLLTVKEFISVHLWESLGYWDKEGMCKSAEPSRGWGKVLPWRLNAWWMLVKERFSSMRSHCALQNCNNSSTLTITIWSLDLSDCWLHPYGIVLIHIGASGEWSEVQEPGVGGDRALLHSNIYERMMCWEKTFTSFLHVEGNRGDLARFLHTHHPPRTRAHSNKSDHGGCRSSLTHTSHSTRSLYSKDIFLKQGLLSLIL